MCDTITHGYTILIVILHGYASQIVDTYNLKIRDAMTHDFIIHTNNCRSEGAIHFTQEDGIGYLLLDNPKAKNALSIHMMRSFPEIISTIEECIQLRTLKMLIIRAKNKDSFCAGGDLRDVRSYLATPEMGQKMCSFMTEQLRRIAQLQCYVVVVVEGYALGGGAELTTVGDWVIASTSAKIGFVQLNLGVTTGWGGGDRLITKVGKSKALHVLAFARVYSAQDAFSIGIVDEIVDTVDDTLQKMIDNVRQKTPDGWNSLLGYMRGKQSEEDAFVRCWGSNFHRNVLGLSVDGVSEKNT